MDIDEAIYFCIYAFMPCLEIDYDPFILFLLYLPCIVLLAHL